MDKSKKWKLESFYKDLAKDDAFESVGFTPEELEANIDAWNAFFAEKGLSDPTTVKAVQAVIDIIGRSIVYRSKDDQFYTPFYVERKATNPPLVKEKRMSKAMTGDFEYWSGAYTAKLANPDDWPNCVKDYTSCNAAKHGVGVFEHDGPASVGLAYYKLSNFQIEAAKIAMEVVEYFKKLYGQELPKQDQEK